MTQLGTESGMGVRTILMVDQDYDSPVIYSVVLRSNGFVVLLASDGSEALDILPRQIPHAVVTELRLPIIDGGALVRYLKQDPATATIPVIVVTASVDSQLRREAEDAGCDLFLLKPCNPRDLRLAVCQVLNDPLPSEFISENRAIGSAPRFAAGHRGPPES